MSSWRGAQLINNKNYFTLYIHTGGNFPEVYSRGLWCDISAGIPISFYAESERFCNRIVDTEILFPSKNISLYIYGQIRTIQQPVQLLQSRYRRKVGLAYHLHVESRFDIGLRIILKKRILKFERTFKSV
jgi:hypothetical protein